MFEKLTNFTKKVADLADKPTLNPNELKAQFDAAPDEVRVYLNKLIDGLIKTTAGDSGAKNIGVTTISGISGSDIQTILEGLATTRAKKQQEAWNDLALINSWVNFGGTQATAQYMKDEMGFVHLKGLIKDGVTSLGNWICSPLPAGYRPGKNIIASCQTASGSTVTSNAKLTIEAAGSIVIGENVANGYLNLSDIPPFRAEL